MKKLNILIGLLISFWGMWLFIDGPFYARGFMVDRYIGIVFFLIGIYYISIEISMSIKKRRTKNESELNDREYKAYGKTLKNKKRLTRRK